MTETAIQRYLDDFVPGLVLECGSYTMAEDEIVAFAQQFDPQPFHTDANAAKDSVFGGLVASGWHTVSVMMRLMVHGYISSSASMGSPGVDAIRWLKPVRPGDTLTVRTHVLEVVPSRSKSDRGIVKSRIEATNQDGDVVATMHGMGMFGRRP